MASRIQGWLAGWSELAYDLASKRVPLLSDYRFDLPMSLIAQQPASARDGSRLMVLSSSGALVRHGRITGLPGYLEALARPCLFVANDTRVLPVRLFVNRQTGGQNAGQGRGRAELLLLPYSPVDTASSGGATRTMRCLAKPMRKLHPGMTLAVLRKGSSHASSPSPTAPQGTETDRSIDSGNCGESGDILEVVGKDERGLTIAVTAQSRRSLLEIIAHHGEVPLPPYILRPDGPAPSDGERYQTLFAERAGAVAAPTAGLHFTKPLIEQLEAAGHRFATVTLHVGPSTFLPLKQEQLDSGTLAPEWYALTSETVSAILAAKREGRPVIAVGTTVVRALESAALAATAKGSPQLIAPTNAGWASAFIQPGFAFKVVDGMLTNFHLPGSSLLLLVSAWFGRQALLARYREAIAEGYRFYSYGDAMLILPSQTLERKPSELPEQDRPGRGMP